MEKKKRARANDHGDHCEDKVYKFNVLLPNGIRVPMMTRNAGEVPLQMFLERVREKSLRILKETEPSNSKHRRKIFWHSKELYIEDALGNKFETNLCIDNFKPNKIHYLRLFDGADQNADTFENMWDLTPDTDLLTELPDEYTFETALADLIDNSLQAVWSNGDGEQRLISVEVNDDRVSVFDTGPGMDGSEENSIVKWGKVGASLHRSSKRLAIGGRPPFLTPYFGMFGYGGIYAAMHLGRHAIVSAKTKHSRKVYWLHLEREALLKRSGYWKVPGSIRDPLVAELEKSPHGSFTKVDIKPKLKLPNISQLQCKLKDIYFPYIQCDEILRSGRTTTPVVFEVNGMNLAEVDGGEIAITNLHSCNGPDFVLNLHFIEKENSMDSSPGIKEPCEANARLKCVYFPIVQGKENIERILDKLKADGCGIVDDFGTFSRICIRRLGRLLPDARCEPLPFMKSKQKGGERVQLLKRCCLRVKCFIDTDAGFHPIPSKTDLAIHHPFTKALKDLGLDPAQKDKEVKVEVFSGGKQLTFAQLRKAYQDWVLEMHAKYDEEFNCNGDESVLLVNAWNAEELGIKSDVVRVHRTISRKGMSWSNGQKVKIFKGAYPACSKNMYATLEYFLLEGFHGDAGAGGDARVICRPMGVPEEDGCVLAIGGTSPKLELQSSKSLPIFVMDPEKCVTVGMDEWNQQVEKLTQKVPATIEVLGLDQCKELGIDGALPTEATICAGFVPPRELVAVLRPSKFTSSCVSNYLDQKYIIKDTYEMSMDIKFTTESAKACQPEHIFSGSVTHTSRVGCQGLYMFQLGSVSSLFQKAGIYSFSFSIRNSACKSCEISVHVKASSKVKRWELLKEDQHLQFNISVGSCFPPFSVARYDVYDNCIPYESIPEIVFQLKSGDVMLFHSNKVKLELSSDQFRVVVRNLRIVTSNLDKIRPSYEATLALSQPDKRLILNIPCQVVPGPLQSVTFHPLQSGNDVLPKQVLQDIKLEMFDRHGNHVKEGTDVELTVYGFSFMDQDGQRRKVDHLGFVDLSGLLKVTGGYGEHVSLSVLSAKQVNYTKKFKIEKRELRILTKVPEFCQSQSELKDITFQIVDSKGNVDESIHDDGKLGESHMLKLRTNWPNFDDSLRYAFRHGRCVISSITLPRLEGSYVIEAFHSCQHELHLKFKVNVARASDTEDNISSDSQAHEDQDNYRSQSIDEQIAFHRVSLMSKNVVTSRTQSKQYGSNHEFGALLLQSPEGNIISSIPRASEDLMTSIVPDYQVVVKRELDDYSLHLKDLEDGLAWLGDHRDMTVKALLQLQGCSCPDIFSFKSELAGVPQLEQSISMSPKEQVLEAIHNKVDSAAAVCSFIPRNSSLKKRHDKLTSNMVGVVALLGSAPSHTLSCLLADYLGEDQMLAIVVQSSVAVTPPEEYERELSSLAADLGKCITKSPLLICLEDIRAYSGSVVESDPQRRLALRDPTLRDGKTPPGFMGYAVNMIDLDVDNLQTKTIMGHGLRGTLFYRLFGELQVYETKEHMKLALGCITDGAVSLDGGLIYGTGMVLLGRKKVDVHFPVMAQENQLAVLRQGVDITQLIEEEKENLSTATQAITHLSNKWRSLKKHIEERCAEYQKLTDRREGCIAESFVIPSQQSLKFSPMPSRDSGN